MVEQDERITHFNNNKFTAAVTYDYHDKVFQRLQSRLNAAERTFRRCLQDLKHLQRPNRDRQEPVPDSPQP